MAIGAAAAAIRCRRLAVMVTPAAPARGISTAASLAEYLPAYHIQRQVWISPNSRRRRFPLISNTNVVHMPITADHPHTDDHRHRHPGRKRPSLLQRPPIHSRMEPAPPGTAHEDPSPSPPLLQPAALPACILDAYDTAAAPLHKATALSVDDPQNVAAICSAAEDLAATIASLIDASAKMVASLRQGSYTPNDDASLACDLAQKVTDCFVDNMTAVRDKLAASSSASSPPSELAQSMPPKSTSDVLIALARVFAADGQLVTHRKALSTLASRAGVLEDRRIHATILSLLGEQPDVPDDVDEDVALHAMAVYQSMCKLAAPPKSPAAAAAELNSLLIAVARCSNRDRYVKFTFKIADALETLIRKQGNLIPPEARSPAIVAFLDTCTSLSFLQSLFSLAARFDALQTPDFQLSLLHAAIRLAGPADEPPKPTARIDACLYWVRRLNHAGATITEAAANLIVSEYVHARLPYHAVAWAAAEVWPRRFVLSQDTILNLLGSFKFEPLAGAPAGKEHHTINELWRHVSASMPLNRNQHLPIPIMTAFSLARAYVGDIDGAIATLKLIASHGTSQVESASQHKPQLPIATLCDFVQTIARHPVARADQIVHAWTTARTLAGSDIQHISPIWLFSAVRTLRKDAQSDLALVIRILFQQSRDGGNLSRKELTSALREMLEANRASNQQPLSNGTYGVLDKYWISAPPSRMNPEVAAKAIEDSVVGSSASILVNVHKSLRKGTDVADSLQFLEHLLTKWQK